MKTPIENDLDFHVAFLLRSLSETMRKKMQEIHVFCQTNLNPSMKEWKVDVFDEVSRIKSDIDRLQQKLQLRIKSRTSP